MAGVHGVCAKIIQFIKDEKNGTSVGIGIAVLTVAIVAIAAVGAIFLLPASIAAAGALAGAAFAVGAIGIGGSTGFIWEAFSKKDDEDSF